MESMRAWRFEPEPETRTAMRFGVVVDMGEEENLEFISFSTDLPAAALEFCPVEPFTDVFVTGTYKLHESDPDGKQEEVASGAEQQTRSGRCLIYQKDATGFRRMQELDFAGILDLKW